VGHPFDTLKVRLQTQSSTNQVYKGLADCFMKTVKMEGLGGLYKGVTSPLAGQMFFRATLFFTFGQAQAALEKPNGSFSVSGAFIAGALTGSTVSFVETPIDLFKSKIQVQIIQQTQNPGAKVQYTGVFTCASYILKNYGIRGAYQGLAATLLRNIPSNALYFANYEWYKELVTPPNKKYSDLPAYVQLTCGGLCGFSYWFFTFPFDVVKSTMQADDADISKRKYKGVIDCMKQMWNTEGYKRFYKGLAPCMLRSFPANAAMLFTYETVRKLVS